MTKIKMHISKVKLPFYPLCEVKYGLQNRVSTVTYVANRIMTWHYLNDVTFIFIKKFQNFLFFNFF